MKISNISTKAGNNWGQNTHTYKKTFALCSRFIDWHEARAIQSGLQ